MEVQALKQIGVLFRVASVFIMTVVIGVEPAEAQGALTASGGNVPLGLWVLNPAHSKQITPATQTLWIVKDDNKQMVWVTVLTDAQGRVTVNSWDGPYNGAPVAVVGGAMTTQLSSPAPGVLHNTGQIKGVGSYTEACVVTLDGKEFDCKGQVNAASGPIDYHEQFDWAGPSPQ